MDNSSLIYIAGHTGLVGSAILRKLKFLGCRNIITRTHQEMDLMDRVKVNSFFAEEKPEYVFLAAARVGGIHANNTYPAEFIYENLMIQTNIIDLSYRYGIKKLLFLGSSCVYPKICPQPMKEEYLLTGPIETTNEPYGIAKLAGIKMCQAYNKQYGTNFISVIPANAYGIHDHFNENGHVVAALINKFHEAKIKDKESVTVWGTGKPKREFFYVDDLADACIFLMREYKDNEVINVGTGCDTSIADLASILQRIVGFDGKITFDLTKPDGAPQRLLDVSKLTSLGWKYKTGLEEGFKMTYEWFVQSVINTI